MMELVTLILFISAFVSQQALGQDGSDIRVVADKLNQDLGIAQPRTIYNQRLFSPHRKMHFGKRLVNQLPQVYELPAPQQMNLQPDRYPYLLSIELDRGQTLQALPEELNPYEEIGGVNNLLYKLVKPVPFESSEGSLSKKQQQLLKQLVGQKSSRLVSSNDDNDDDDENDELERARPSSNLLNDQEQIINVNTRSMQSNSLSSTNVPKSFISSLLYGRNSVPRSMRSSFRPPSDYRFMHFGRK